MDVSSGKRVVRERRGPHLEVALPVPLRCGHCFGPANTMWRKLLYSGFHTPKAVTYHEPTVMWLFMIGHSLGRMETCFSPSTQGAETTPHLKSRFCLQAILKKKKRALCKILRLTDLVEPVLKELEQRRTCRGYWVNIFNAIQNIGRTTQVKYEFKIDGPRPGTRGARSIYLTPYKT